MITTLMYIFLDIGIIFLGIAVYYFITKDVKSVFFDVRSQKVTEPPKSTAPETIETLDKGEKPRAELIREIKDGWQEEPEEDVEETTDRETELLEGEASKDKTELLNEADKNIDKTELLNEEDQEDETELLSEDETELLKEDKTELLENDKTELL